MMKRVQKHIDSNVTAADEVLQQSEEVVTKIETKESEVEQAIDQQIKQTRNRRKRRENIKRIRNQSSLFSKCYVWSGNPFPNRNRKSLLLQPFERLSYL